MDSLLVEELSDICNGLGCLVQLLSVCNAVEDHHSNNLVPFAEMLECRFASVVDKLQSGDVVFVSVERS